MIAPMAPRSTVNSTDPNSKPGPAGYGSQDVRQRPANPFPYHIDFENASTASAPAQRVDITDQLDPNLDWSTFQWTGFGFGDNTISIPANTQHYETTLPMTYDGVTFRVVVTLDLNPLTGMVHASFQSLNAANLMTGLANCPGTLPLGPLNPDADLPPSVLIGFLPPEDGTGRGMGNITYTVRPKAGLATGTQIRNVADVTFDLGNTIATDQVSETDPTQGVDPSKQALVTIDAVPPTSSVAALPAYLTTNNFNVNWSGSDDPGGSGIGSYTIYVSMDGGTYAPWLTATTQTSATFTGVDGHTYSFFSLATDNAGNLQSVPTSAQATTAVDITTPTSTVAALPAFSPGSFTLDWSGSNPNGLAIASYDVYVSEDGGAFTPLLTDTPLTSTTFTGANNHTYAFYSVATDVVGKSQPTPASAQASTKVDSVAPTSSVFALPAISLPTFTVSWSGSDNPGGSGLAYYDIYVSDNNGPFTRWLTATTATSTSYTGLDGHTYGFFSVATDNVGNVEATPTAAQATTLVNTNLNIQVTSSITQPVYGQTESFDADLTPAGSGLPVPTGTLQFLVDGAAFGSPVTLVNGVADSPSLSSLVVGTHVIAADYSGDGTYSAQNSTLPETIAKATLIATANDQVKDYGAQVPALTYMLTGFVNGEDATTAGVTGVPSLTTLATAASPVGKYAIHVDVTNLSAANYTFVGMDGTLTVNSAVLTVTASNLDMDHYDAVPNLTYAISGYVNGDPSSVVTGAPILATSATSTSSAGFYPITIASGSLTAENYTFVVVPGTLTVHPKVMDIRVEYGSKSLSLIGLNRDLPFVNINAIDVLFSDDVAVTSNDLTLTGVNIPSYALSGFRYNAATRDASWTLPSPLGIDHLMMALDGTSVTGVHTPSPSIHLRSDFDQDFAVLPGDVNGDGVVNSQDQVLVRNQMVGTGDPGLASWADVDGSGVVDINDFNQVKKRAGSHFN